jgi:ABC-type phosphate transport system substrate-binding protein
MAALALLLTAFSLQAQNSEPEARTQEAGKSSTVGSSATTPQKVIVITGARFSYKLVEKWIDDYNKVNPNVQIIVES